MIHLLIIYDVLIFSSFQLKDSHWTTIFVHGTKYWYWSKKGIETLLINILFIPAINGWHIPQPGTVTGDRDTVAQKTSMAHTYMEIIAS